MPRHIEVLVHASADCWVINLPGQQIVARDKTMAVNLVRHYALQRNLTASIVWHEPELNQPR